MAETPTTEAGGLTDQELVEALPSQFKKKEFKAVEYVIESLPPDVDEDWLLAEKETKENLLLLVQSDLSSRVLRSYNNFVQGMNQIQELGQDLRKTAVFCKEARAKLANSKDELTRSGFQILLLSKRKQELNSVLSHLSAIHQILVTEKQLLQLIEEEEYPEAIKKCHDSQKALASRSLSQFTCVNTLNARLQNIYRIIIEKLRSSLLDNCSSFNPDSYSSALIAYSSLGKSNRVVDRLQRHFLNTLNLNTHNILNAHVFSDEENIAKADELKTLAYAELSKHLKGKRFISCMMNTLESHTNIMYNLDRMCHWHKLNNSNFTDIHSALERFKKTLWSEMQRSTATLLRTADLSHYQIDEFLLVLDSVNLFVDIGDSFSKTKAHSLRGSIKSHIKKFFIKTHKDKLEDLPVLLAAENWTALPLENNSYDILDIKDISSFMNSSKASNEQKFKADIVFSSFSVEGNPFSVDKNSTPQNSKHQHTLPNGNPSPKISKTEEERINPALLAQYVDEGDGQPLDLNHLSSNLGREGPLLSQSCIQFAQYIGKYLHMMQVLRPICFEIFIGITHLFSYYMYMVYHFFGDNNLEEVSPTLSSTLQKIHKKHIHAPGTEKKNAYSIELAELSPVRMAPQEDLSSLQARMVSVESLNFLAEAMNTVKPNIKPLIPQNRKQYMDSFYEKHVDVVALLADHIYHVTTKSLLNLSGYENKIGNVKWDISDVGVNHNPYINEMVREFQNFVGITRKGEESGYIPESVLLKLWDHAIHLSMNTLVEGFSRAKKCTFEGRGLMKLDFQTFQTGLIKLDPQLRVLCQTAGRKVDIFISAFYEPENGLDDW
eukprot:CAMPEP_0174266650 /NCGR_PEP_ID=MMETSP0439-20130205/31006_1 /TAXON_ID=0 /ORGANISM="Stereomyxa ramosa, Strain Chinc5" /LENGTH=832 /DNA_ID=CAMNT_0015353745 /DNA_START=31 /DNA_END=2526 /DNA_ORIENTATION=+